MPTARKTPTARKSVAASPSPASPAVKVRRRPAAQAPAARKAAAAEVVAAKPAAPSAAEPARPAKGKAKPVRDSFTMPQADFDLVSTLKQRALAFQRPAKKSELLRAGLHVLSALDDNRLRAALDALTPLKPGRPKKGG